MKVSIVIFYKEDRGFLTECIESAKNQDYAGKYEIILQCGDYTSAENFNKGVHKAKGKYIKGCAEDDLLTPNCLTDLMAASARYDLDVVVSNAINFYPDGNEVFYSSSIPDTVGQLARHNTIHGGTVLYKRQALIDIDIMDETLYFAEEFDMNIRLALAGKKFGYVNKTTFKYRCWDGMKSMQTLVLDSDLYMNRKNAIRKTVKEKYENEQTKINICRTAK